MSDPSSFDPPALEALATLLPAYQFEYLIALDGNAAVYKARQKSLDRDVAIKILPKEREADPVFREISQSAARSMARLNHPNLIGVYDSGEIDGYGFIVMEFVGGKPLARSAYGKQIDPQQAVELVIGICNGLAHAHDHGIVHSNLSPANILLNQEAVPKIGDFGMIHAVEGGTPGYIAPEQSGQTSGTGPQADQYAAGVILYELLTGQRYHSDSPPPSTLAQVDPAMDAICQRATHPTPSQRYPNCESLMEVLGAWLKDNRNPGISAPSAANTPASHRRGAPPAPRVPGAPVAPVKSGGSAWVNLLLILVLAAGGYYGWKHFTSQPATTPVSTGAQDRTAPSPTPEIVPTPPASTAKTAPTSEPQTGSSTDPATASAQPSTREAATDSLTPRAIELIAATEQERQAALAENVKKLVWDLDTWIRTLPKKDQDLWQPHIDTLKTTIRDSRVPEGTSDQNASPAMAKAISYATESQKKIDAAYLAKVTRFRDLYVPRLQAAIADGEKKNLDTKALRRRLSAATDIESWVKSLGGDSTPDNPTLTPPPSPGIIDTSGANPFGVPIEE